LLVDIHVHTSPGSRCSSMTIASYAEAVAELGLKCVCLTNHGDMNDYRLLVDMLPGAVLLVPGVEISSSRGDFLIYSTDIGFLMSLSPLQELPPEAGIPEDSAVVWAHPFAGIPGGLEANDEHVRWVAPRVDGIEVHNGNWPDRLASNSAAEIANHHGLAPMGGSDAHRLSQLGRCWTEMEEIETPSDFIEAVKSGRTRPVRNGS
jgi:predicted metal-dependent phosphoesterase TrpH